MPTFTTCAILTNGCERTDAQGQTGAIRAFPPRIIHMLAGNSPAGCISSIAQGAMLKATNVFKMPSSDPFSCVAVLRTMADIDPEHPVVKSMSAVYWRGGDERIERTIYRPQYFSRIVAWGGGSAIDNVIRYLSPGLQLVSFDPKTSISMIGPEAFRSDEAIAQVAEAAAEDVSTFNQEACLASRIPLRRRRAQRRREILREAAGASRCRPFPGLRRRTAPARRAARGSGNAAAHG